MASPAVTYTFANSTTADATQVNQNFTDLINGLTDGTKDLSISALTCAGTATLNGNVALGNSSSDTLTITAVLSSSLAMGTTFAYDFGSATVGVKSLYLGSNDSAAKSVRVIAPVVGTSYTLTLPTTPGTARDQVESDGSGGLSFQPTRRSPTDAQNYSLATAVASNAMTLTLNGANASAPSASNQVDIVFRNATAATGTPVTRTLTSAPTLTISSGATLGQSNGVAGYIYVYAIDNAGTVELAVSSTRYDEGTVVSTTAMSGSATDFFTVYSTSARSSVPLRLIGRIKNSQTTAGTYAANALELSLPPFFTGRQIVVGGAQTTDGTYGAGTFGAPTNQPFVSLTPGKTGRYKISLSGAWTNSTGSTRIGARILAADGSPVVVFSQEATMDVSAGMAGSPIPFNVYQIVWLTAGSLYTFALQGIISAGAGTLTFRQSPQASGVAMIAEQMD